MNPLPREYYLQDTELVAKSLLGKKLFFRERGKTLSGIIVETEAYLGFKDPACHSYHGKKTDRVKTMYLPGGHSYIYFIYGMYFCFNIVTGSEEQPEAVLIRAVQPDDSSLESFRKNRGEKIKDIELTNGPGKLCSAYGINKSHNGIDLTTPPPSKSKAFIWIEDGIEVQPQQILSSSRIGIETKEEAAKWPLRFYIDKNPYVSKEK